MSKREVQTSLLGRIAVLGCKGNEAFQVKQNPPGSGVVMVHDRNYVWANREAEIVTIYQDADRNVRYTVNIDGRLVDLYSTEFTVKP